MRKYTVTLGRVIVKTDWIGHRSSAIQYNPSLVYTHLRPSQTLRSPPQFHSRPLQPFQGPQSSLKVLPTPLWAITALSRLSQFRSRPFQSFQSTLPILCKARTAHCLVRFCAAVSGPLIMPLPIKLRCCRIHSPNFFSFLLSASFLTASFLLPVSLFSSFH